MENLSGKFLVAIPELEDVNFYRSVVLVISHTSEGATGVVINRPSSKSIGDVWGQVSGEPCSQDGLIYIGGPVQGRLIALHTHPEFAEIMITPRIFATFRRENLGKVIKDPQGEIKLFAGYSGWGPDQLESELEQGGWLMLPGVPDQVFDTPEGIWEQGCTQVGDDVLKSQLGNHIPDDPSLN